MSSQAPPADPLPTFERFVAAINARQPESLAALMSPDHLFVDSVGNRACGVATMLAGWRGYFTMCPDYWIRIDRALSGSDTVLAVGEAGGTVDGIPWSTPAAWQALIHGELVTEWRVFADNKPVYEILARRA
jgi:ketosteroid isomerase-like protein